MVMRSVGRGVFGVVAVVVAGASAGAGCSSSSTDTSGSDAGTVETGAQDTSAPATACNGHAELCGRTYDQVAFPGTHDAYSNVAQGFTVPDQSYPMARQLADGVRVLHMELKPKAEGDAGATAPYLCHAFCEFGGTALVDGLGEVKSFADAHPNDVVTLLMESSDLTRDVIADVVTKSGIAPLLHEQAAGAPWPTLGDMTKSGKRVVVFMADLSGTGGATFPWMHDRFSWTWETPWNNQTPADFARCDADRGKKGSSLYVVDTYREDEATPTTVAAATVNTDPFLASRVFLCKKSAGVLPNFVMVNYYEVGDVFRVVDMLNGFAAAPNDDPSGFPPAAFPDADGGGY